MTDRLRALAREVPKPQARKLRDRATMNILTVTDPVPEVVKPIVRHLLSALETAERYINAQRQDLLSRTDPPVSEGRTEPHEQPMSTPGEIHCRHCDVDIRFMDGAWLDRETHSTCEVEPGTPSQKHEPPKQRLSPDDAMDIYVPGAWKCMKCGFALSQATMFIGSGEIGCSRDQVMTMTGEQCPNDGTEMVRVTWRDRAVENQQWGESLMNEIIALVGAEHLPGALEAVKHHRKALQSIAANSCCSVCQEAKLVALRALSAVPTLTAPQSFPIYQCEEWQCRHVFDNQRCCGLPIGHDGDHVPAETT